jgi:hypothetical protein
MSLLLHTYFLCRLLFPDGRMAAGGRGSRESRRKSTVIKVSLKRFLGRGKLIHWPMLGIVQKVFITRFDRK